MSALKKCLGMLALLVAGPLAQAHIASNGFLSLQVERAEVSGSLELAIRDGELAVGLDRDRDGKVSWGELRDSWPAPRGRANLSLVRCRSTSASMVTTCGCRSPPTAAARLSA